jgi:hypothetical protein
MTHRRPHSPAPRVLAWWSLVVLTLAIAPIDGAQRTNEKTPEKTPGIRTSGKLLRPKIEPGKERPPVAPLKVPYPGAVDPWHVVQNIKAIANQSSSDVEVGLPDLRMTDGDLRARRVLQVKSEQIPSYLVVELVDAQGNRVANFALTKDGTPIMFEDARGDQDQGSLDLANAKSRVQARRGKAPAAAEYVYFTNGAERGISYCRPLVAVATEKGAVYLNSKGEAFVEETSALNAELPKIEARTGPEAEGRANALKRSNKPLRAVGQW